MYSDTVYMKNSYMTTTGGTTKNELQEYCQKSGLILPSYSTVRATPQPNLTWLSTVSILIKRDGEYFMENFAGTMSKTKIGAELLAAEKALDRIKMLEIAKKCSGLQINSLADEGDLESQSPLRSPTSLFYKPEIHKPSSIATSLYKSEIHKQSLYKHVDIQNTKMVASLKKKTVLLVDIENMPKIIEDFLGGTPRIPDNFWIYAFVGKHHPLAGVRCGIENDTLVPTNLVGRRNFDNFIKVISPSTRKDGTDTCMQMYTGIFLYKESFDEYLVCTRDHFGGTLVEFICSNEPDHPWKQKNANLVTCVEHIQKCLDDIGYTEKD
jgi:hypothetical protein